MEERKFNLKDYQKWCEEHKKDILSENSLKEYKLSLEKENALKKAKNNEIKKIKMESLINLIKGAMMLCSQDEKLKEMEKLSIKTIECIDEKLGEAIYESLVFAYGSTLVEIVNGVITVIEIANDIKESSKEQDKGEEEND